MKVKSGLNKVKEKNAVKEQKSAKEQKSLKAQKSAKPQKPVRAQKPVKLQKPVKPQRPAKPQVPAEWLYLTDRQITVRDVAAAFDSEERVEIWEEAGVAEVILNDKASMDMEITEADLGDEESNRFLQENQVKTLFLVTIPPLEFEAAKDCMEKIIAANGGFFCGDTEDFTPVVRLIWERR